MINAAHLDPRIGMLNSGRFYAFVHGYHQPETVGTLDEVEIALGLRETPAPAASSPVKPDAKRWNVVMRFQYPAWDEVDGIHYENIIAMTKREANARARRQAEDDGHAWSGRGRYTFTATEAD